MKPHAFIAMPFGIKADADGQPADFNRICDELLKPALEDAGCEVFRADDEERAGDIRADMFQELLVADLVLADLTVDNPNVWYELGVRHALRARGVVLTMGPRTTKVFDVGPDRKFKYRLKDGAPDPATLAEDRAALAAMARATLDASVKRKLSPVYTLLPHLKEPDWRSLLIKDDNEFGDDYARWRSRLEVAVRKNRAGDILVLADETPTRALWLEAKCEAGRALQSLKQYRFALEQFDAALTVEPEHRDALQRRVVCLGRSGQPEEAAEAARQLVAAHPGDAAVWALSGRVEKDRWVSRWRTPAQTTGHNAEPDSAAMLAAAKLELAALGHALLPYRQAFIADPADHHPGINALSLTMLRQHLGADVDADDLQRLAGGVQWAAQAAQQRDPRDYWAHASWAEACLLLRGGEEAVAAMRAAAALADRNWFALDSTLQGLHLLRDLQFRPADTAAVAAVIEAEIKRSAPPLEPRQVLVFAGHMVDAPDRPTPRFPPSSVAAAAAQIDAALDAFGAAPGDLAMTQGAAGADLLFAESCARRGIEVQLMLPLAEPEFVARSIMRSAESALWRDRFYKLLGALPTKPRVMPVELGPLPRGQTSPFERCNLWLLHTALSFGPEKLRFLCLWDGAGSDGPGGTRHSYEEAQRRSGRAVWIDSRSLGR
jgi:tetratricopeptide (TPR) repeat protein